MESIEDMVSRYILAANQSASTLFEKELYGFFLVVVYSAIDTLGLLNAPADQIEATGESFKAWARDFLIPNSPDEYNAEDLWALGVGSSTLSGRNLVSRAKAKPGSSNTT